MIYEVRTYTLRPGTVAEFEERFAKRKTLREKHSKLGAFWHTDFGPLNQVIHAWPYDNLQHRTAVREAMAKDAELQALPGGRDLIAEQEADIMIPAPFMQPLGSRNFGTAARSPGRASSGAFDGLAVVSSSTVKVAPFPLPALCARIVPPCSSTIARLTARPIPNPPYIGRASGKPCSKASKIRGSKLGSIPIPVSVICTSTRPGRGLSVITCTRPPCGVNFAAFLRMFQKTCCSRAASPITKQSVAYL